MGSSPLLSIIIANLNGKDVLFLCLDSIFNQEFKDFEVILVDNASTDDSVKMIRDFFPSVKIIQLEKNHGYAEANNIGYEHSAGEYILLLNNDAILGKNTLSGLIHEFGEVDHAGVIQSKIILTENRGLDECGSFLTKTGFLLYNGLYEDPNNPNYNKITPVFSVKAVCILTKREIIEKIGLFDNDYFVFFEEKDFCHRLWISGYKVFFTPSTEVYHFWGSTTNPQKSNKVPYEFQFHSYKNRICTYLKNFEIITLIKIMSIHLPLLCGISIYYALSGSPKMSWAIIRAMIWNIKNLKNTLKKRRNVQNNLRKVRDADILPFILKKKSMSLIMDTNYKSLKKQVK
jgi:GT2 family glycosyltransferase